MTNRTTKTGYGTDRVVEGAKPAYKTHATGGRVASEVDKRAEYAAKMEARYGPQPARPWPFDPAEPSPRRQTWGNRFKAFRRYLGSWAFLEHVQWVLLYVVSLIVVMRMYASGGY